MRKLISAIIFGLFLMTTQSYAGVNVGLQIGEAAFYGEGRETLSNNQGGTGSSQAITTEAGAFTDGISAMFLEYAFEDVPIALGIERVIDTIKTPTNVNELHGVPSMKTNTVSAEFQNIMGIYATVKIPFGLYLKAGYKEAEVETKEVMQTNSSYPDQDVDGYMFGIGWEKVFDNEFFARLEANATLWDEVSVNSDAGTYANIKINDMMSARAMLALGKSF
jgi:hypothetical protein